MSQKEHHEQNSRYVYLLGQWGSKVEPVCRATVENADRAHIIEQGSPVLVTSWHTQKAVPIVGPLGKQMRLLV